MSDDFFNFPSFYDYVAACGEYHHFAEVGVYTGASVVYLADLLRKRNTPWKLHAIDLWERVNAETDYERIIGPEIYDQFQQRITDNKLEGLIDVIHGDSAKAATMFRDRGLDIVFIDANHAYEHVVADIKAWLPKIRSGGMIAGHDICEPSCGVRAAVDEIFPAGYEIKAGCWFSVVP